jgi:hypothetical protein
MTEARITQQYIEVAVLEPATARITQQYVEVALELFYAVRTKLATDITSYTVQLNGISETFNPPAITGTTTELTIWFEYADNSSFTDSTTSTSFEITEIGSFQDFVSVDFTTFYYFRAVATDGVNTWYGLTETFLATDYYYQETTSDFATGTLEDVEVSGNNLQLISGNLTGSRLTPVLDISSLNNISNSIIKWSSSEPEGTELIIEARVSNDSGSNWSEWEVIENESSAMNLFLLTDLPNARFQFKQTLISDTIGITPTLSEFEVFIADSFLSPPVFNPSGGNHYSNQYISLSCPTEDSEIYYTLDGTDPLEEGFLYEDETFLISDGLVIKAYSYVYDENNLEDPNLYSPVITNTYNIVPFPESEYKIIHAYRFRNDDGTEVSATWREDENVNAEEGANTSLRMRVGFSGQVDVGPQKLQLDYRIKRADEGTFTDWRIVPGSEGYSGTIRITETGAVRLTEIGEIRVIENFEETEGS